MPNRVIRESLLDSERYWSCTIEARELYRHLQLLCDDLGCISLAPVFIRRRCFDVAPPQTKIDTFLQQLSDHDLIRIYMVNDARYAFVPRFGQRTRLMYLKHPKPPFELYKDDADAVEKFSKIKGNKVNLSDTCLTADRLMTAESNPIQSKKVLGVTESPTREIQKTVLNKKFKPDSTSETVEANRRIAQKLLQGE